MTEVRARGAWRLGVWITLGVLVLALIGAVAVTRWRTADADAAWVHDFDTRPEIVDHDDDHLLVRHSGDLTVLDRADGSVVGSVRVKDLEVAPGGTVLHDSLRDPALVPNGIALTLAAAGTASFEGRVNSVVGVIDHSGEWTWQREVALSDSMVVGAGVGAIADARADVVQGVDLATGKTLWEKKGLQPLWFTDVAERPSAVVSRKDDQLWVTALGNGETTSYPDTFAPRLMGDRVVLVNDNACAILIHHRTGSTPVDWGGLDKPVECNVAAAGEGHAWITSDGNETDSKPARVYVLDLETATVGDSGFAATTNVTEQVHDEGPSNIIAVRHGDTVSLLDARVAAVTWSREWSGRWAYVGGSDVVVLVREVSWWEATAGGVDPGSLAFDLRSPEGRRLGTTYEAGRQWASSRGLDHGEVVLGFDNRILMLR